MVLIRLLSDLSIVSTDKSSPSLPCYLEHHCDFEFRYFGDCGKLNSTTIKGYKQILGKFGEIQREFVDVYSPDSDNDCRGGGGGHQHLSMHANEEYVLQALRAGACGYLLKDAVVA